RFLWFEVPQAFVHRQSLGETAALCVVVAQQLERVHVIGVAADDALHELDPGVEIALGGATQFFAGGAFGRHTTGTFFPSGAGKSSAGTRVKASTRFGSCPPD